MLLRSARLIARLTLGILVILQGQADLLAAHFSTSNYSASCSSASGVSEETATSSCCDTQQQTCSCGCGCCAELAKPAESETHSADASRDEQSLDDDGTEQLRPIAPCCPCSPACPLGVCSSSVVSAPAFVPCGYVQIEPSGQGRLVADYSRLAPDANPQELILPPRA